MSVLLHCLILQVLAMDGLGVRMLSAGLHVQQGQNLPCQCAGSLAIQAFHGADA